MKIAKNDINLRVATDREIDEAHTIDETAKNILVSETAFPGYTSYYRGIMNDNGEMDSAGWIGKL